MHEEEVLRMVARAGQNPGEAGMANCELHGFLAMPQYTHLSMGTRVLPSRGGWQGLHERISVWGMCLPVGRALSGRVSSLCSSPSPGP